MWYQMVLSSETNEFLEAYWCSKHYYMYSTVCDTQIEEANCFEKTDIGSAENSSTNKYSLL